MHESQFHSLGINDFTPAEVRRTGANLDDVQPALMIMLQRVRTDIGRRIALLPNGMTTGAHKAPEHAQGLAVDFGFFEKDGHVDIRAVAYALLAAGARGIGLYWNGTAYSVHADLRRSYATWRGVKEHGESRWSYGPLLIDPRGLV